MLGNERIKLLEYLQTADLENDIELKTAIEFVTRECNGDCCIQQERVNKMLLEEARQRFLAYLKGIDRSNETIVGYGKDMKMFINYMNTKYNSPCYLQEVTETDIEEYMVYLKSEREYTQGSRARSLNTLRSLYNWAVKKQIAIRNIPACVDNIKVKRKERTYLIEEEVYALLEKIHQPIVHAVIKTLYMTGLRISECTGLTLNNVDLEGDMIYVIGGKGDKDRVIPISDKLHKHLTGYLKSTRPKNIASNFFFATERSGKVTASYINEVLKDTTTELGWSKVVTCHILRHSFASKLVKEDVNLVELQKLLGHSSLNVTSIYTHTNMTNLQSAVNLI